MTANSIAGNDTAARVSLWPVLVAPIAAGLYYLAIKLAFVQSIVSVLGRTDFFDLSTPHWGTHWIFRGAAEAIAVGFGTFVAAGLAVGREHTAAITGGCAISVGFIAKLLITYVVWNEHDAGMQVILEPWYQYAIDAAVVLAAPFIGAYVAEAAEDMHRDQTNGFGGINRAHFLWLWVVAYAYAVGFITPMARIYIQQGQNIVALFLVFLINGIPAAAIGVPGYYGITLLAGQHGATMHPAGRNLVGVLVLVFGFLVGLIIQFGWYWMMQKIYETIFG